MKLVKSYQKGMVESKIQPDALLLTGVRNFSTAAANFGGNMAATGATTQPTTQKQRDGNARGTTP